MLIACFITSSAFVLSLHNGFGLFIILHLNLFAILIIFFESVVLYVWSIIELLILDKMASSVRLNLLIFKNFYF